MKLKNYKNFFALEKIFDPSYYLYFYENNFITKEQTQKEIEFLRQHVLLNNPLKILDLACGYGRHTNALAALGHDVTGIDIIHGFLAKAKKNAEMRKLRVKYISQDMREISFFNIFDVVLLLGLSFGYFDDETNFKVLENISKALKPKGLFCLDIINRDTLLKYLSQFYIIEKGDDLMIDQYNFDLLSMSRI